MSLRTMLVGLGILGSIAITIMLAPANSELPVRMLLVPVALAGLLAGAYALFDAYLWRFASTIRRPILAGTWRASIQSSWTDPTTNEKASMIEAYVVITQTMRALRMRLMTTESESELSVSDIHEVSPGVFQISAVYTAAPREGTRLHAPAHRGVLLLDVYGKKPKVVEGRYWTDRETQGVITLCGRRTGQAESFQQAKLGVAA